jgi:hypothetical protein
LPNFLIELGVFPLLKLRHSQYPLLADNYPSQQWLSFCTSHALNCFLLGWEKNGHGTISWLCVSAIVHNSTTLLPIHENADCSMYILLCISLLSIV